jgi:pyrroline-5-carboxylate reductase
MSMATAARDLQRAIPVGSDVQVVPRTTSELRAFLLAQLHWERYRASRMVLVHLLALCGLCFWVPISGLARAAIAAGCGACFVAALFAGMMEWRWGRERNRRAGALSRPGGPV